MFIVVVFKLNLIAVIIVKMLPDFLNNVGPTMQDMPRDDFSPLMNVAEVAINCEEKDMCPLIIPKHHQHHQQHSSQLCSPQEAYTHTNNNNCEIFSNHVPPEPHTNWQQRTSLNSSQCFVYRSQHHQSHYSHHKLLLQGSDDPLISHGAHSVLAPEDEENPAEFAKCLMSNEKKIDMNYVQYQQQKQNIMQQTNPSFSSQMTSNHQQAEHRSTLRSGCSNLTKQQLKVKANMMSARNRQQQQQQQQHQINSNDHVRNAPSAVNSKQRQLKIKKKPSTSVKLRFHHQALPTEYLSHYEATQGHARPLPIMQQLKLPTTSTKVNAQVSPKIGHNRSSHENVRSWLQKIAEIHRNATVNQLATVKNSAVPAPNKEKFVGLPLQNSSQCLPSDSISNESNVFNRLEKPITEIIGSTCHDKMDQKHYKSNRQQKIFPNYNDLPYMGEITLDHLKPRRGRKPKKADICHLIYKNYGTLLPHKLKPSAHPQFMADNSQSKGVTTFTMVVTAGEQPLNLCLRDQNVDTLSLTSGEDDDFTETNSSCPTPITTPSDMLRDTMLAANMKQALTNSNFPQKCEQEELDQPHLTTYYQKILESSTLLQQFNSGQLETIQKDNQLALKIPLPNGLLLGQLKTEKSITTTTNPSRSNDYPEPTSTPSSLKSENSLANANSFINACNTSSTISNIQPQKRKRSAIFIPPLPTDTSPTNPANEVSICKFKFTGGTYPTLQEKKMLSVDAGGNYRYFSGTGDKASRGYEYFPRESLQQTAGLLPGLNCSGEKMNVDVELITPEPYAHEATLNETKTQNSPHQWPAQTKTSPNQTKLGLANPNEENISSSSRLKDMVNSENYCSLSCKKSNAFHQLKRGTQRGKLEKTFKEQGFLIQTQQLESAEGATYCKFRQLKKFSRYLFRNWKDYLPEELQQDDKAPILTTTLAADVTQHDNNNDINGADNNLNSSGPFTKLKYEPPLGNS